MAWKSPKPLCVCDRPVWIRVLCPDFQDAGPGASTLRYSYTCTPGYSGEKNQQALPQGGHNNTTNMKQLSMWGLLLALFLAGAPLQAQNDYFFPNYTGTFDAAIPTPEQFLGYPIGSHYTRHDQIVAYYQELARLSDRATIQEIGRTYEYRPQVILTITDPANHQRLEEIRQEHLRWIDPTRTPAGDPAKMPVLVHLGYSVHGAETSSGEAALLTAYFLTAAQDPTVVQWLREAVVSMDPSLNPDGRDRMANWHNQFKSFPPVADPQDLEHNAAWPGGRTNHFFFDLNRDWLPAVHPESHARLNFYHQWYPNVVIDFHEMGTNSTYYFEPSPPLGSESPIVPRANYEVLNVRMARYHAEALDKLGALYFTKESFDNFSPIYGSTYPDFEGGLGITFEVGSSRGIVQESQDGLKTFGFTIRSHVANGIATVKGAVAERELFLRYQREFFQSALTDAAKNPHKAFVFGDEADPGITRRFLALLLQHRLEVYQNPTTVKVNGKTFTSGNSYIVPTSQPHYRIVHSLFEEMTTFIDSVFYDVTGYAVAHGYGVAFAPITDSRFSKGNRVTAVPTAQGGVQGSVASYAYLFSWSDYQAPRALYQLQRAGVLVKTAFRPFAAGLPDGSKRSFGYGSMVIPVALQSISADSLYRVVHRVGQENGLVITPVSTGFSAEGIDLGSNNIRTVTQPKVALIGGEGISPNDFGELWYFCNQHLQLPVSKLTLDGLGRRGGLDRYSVIIMPNGNYQGLSTGATEQLQDWVAKGGTLITCGNATQWAMQKKIAPENLVVPPARDSSGRQPFAFDQAGEINGAQNIGGGIFRATIDITNPIGFGVQRPDLYVFRDSRLFLKPSKNPYANVVRYTANPLVSGYVSKSNQQQLGNTLAVTVQNQGSGRVVLFADNPAFRGYWLGTMRLVYNAIFLGDLIRVPSAP